MILEAAATAQIETAETSDSLNEVIADKIRFQEREGIDDPFYIVDLNDVIKKHRLWTNLFPRVTPFYAVKCLDNVVIMGLLAQLGTGFDCASKNEIVQVLGLGVSADRIIYANPCKQRDMIVHAANVGVNLMTFDNEEELYKVKKSFPQARLVLRILPPTTKKVTVELGNKFGCHPDQVRPLLEKAKALELSVVGISFHVGCGCYDVATFGAAVESAASAFQTAAEVGFSCNILDIGGGFPGYPGMGITIEEIAEVMTPALEKHFPEERGVQIISEPGTFFVASALHLTTQVIGKRTRIKNEASTQEKKGDKSNKEISYYINDGIFGSFCRAFTGYRIPPPIIHPSRPSSQLFYSIIYGPTCDGTDVVLKNHFMCEADVGDWFIFPYMGHYTASVACSFNGMPRARMYYIKMANFDSVFTFNAQDVTPNTKEESF